MKASYGFTITRTTQTGLMEFLNEKGFRSESAILENQLEKSTFDKVGGSKLVRELKADCRIASMKKSIMLNY
jgi:hypothetical protein